MACNVFNSTANNSEVYKLSSHHWHVMTTARAWQTSSGRRDWWSVEWASSEHKNEHQQWISPQCCLRTDLLIPLCLRAQKLCESGGGRPGLPVPNSPYGLCGHRTTLNLNTSSSGSFNFICHNPLPTQRNGSWKVNQTFVCDLMNCVSPRCGPRSGF